MRWRGVSVLAALLIVVGAIISPVAYGQGGASLNVVANQANFGAASPWVKFLEEKGVQVKYVAPKDFAKAKAEKFVVVMGGPKDADEIGKVVAQALSPEEAKQIEGAGATIVKSDVWGKDQNVIFFAGMNAQAVEEARKNNRETWWPKIAGWFDIEEGQKAGGY